MQDLDIRTNLKHNFAVNMIDGGFFGLGLGFTSFVTVLPLFVSNYTSNALLIGLVPAIHNVGWQLPQLFTAYSTSRQNRYLTLLNKLTIHERLPFVFLAVVAWFSPTLGIQLTLALTFLLLVWQGLGGGFAATAWQSMIGKIFPSSIRGTFYGAQAAAANFLASIAAILAGIILERRVSPLDFTICFLLTSLAMLISWVFLALTREPSLEQPSTTDSPAAFRTHVAEILHTDHNFRRYLFARILAHFGTLAYAFYTVYVVDVLEVSESTIGVMTAIFLGTQILANPIMGWIGDRTSHKSIMVFGMLSAASSAFIASQASSPGWFYLVFVLAGIGNVSLWTTGLALIAQFGKDYQRPVYIGLANTLVAPATIIAPLLGGLLVNYTGFSTAFITSSLCAVFTAIALAYLVKDPHSQTRSGQP